MKHVCDRGIDIRKHVGGPDFGWLVRTPCMTSTLTKNQVICDKREYLTEEEEAAEEAEMLRAMKAFADGKSQCCGVEMIEQGTNRFCSKCKQWTGRVCSNDDILEMGGGEE